MRYLSVLDILEETAARLPEKVYVEDERGEATYAEVVERAKRFGWGLSRVLGGERQRPVVLFMEKSVECLCAMFGTLYSGNFYVPMDVHTPRERLNSILATLENPLVVSSERDVKALAKAGYEGPTLRFEALEATLLDEAAEKGLARLRARLVDAELQYVLFTSGSTGTPKGLAVRHRSVVDYVEGFTSRVDVEEGDIHGNQSPFYVTMSLKDVFMTLRAGATICLVPQRLFATPKRMLQYLDDHHVTTLMWVPTAYRMVSQFDALSSVKPRDLKKFLFSGEATPIAVYDYWRAHYPDATFTQQYGSTETTGACMSYTLPKGRRFEGALPIGRPLPNAGVVLLDERDQLVDPADTATEGEICVFGACLSAGYYHDPAKTAEVFVQSPLATAYPEPMLRTGDMGRYDEEGNLVFATRLDDQVKLGGRRIELGEVEQAFCTLEGRGACACVLDAAHERLVLFYVGEAERRDLVRAVRERLPKYMIPTAYVRLETLPQLPGGKLDRKTLKRLANDA